MPALWGRKRVSFHSCENWSSEERADLFRNMFSWLVQWQPSARGQGCRRDDREVPALREFTSLPHFSLRVLCNYLFTFHFYKGTQRHAKLPIRALGQLDRIIVVPLKCSLTKSKDFLYGTGEEMSYCMFDFHSYYWWSKSITKESRK